MVQHNDADSFAKWRCQRCSITKSERSNICETQLVSIVPDIGPDKPLPSISPRFSAKSVSRLCVLQTVHSADGDGSANQGVNQVTAGTHLDQGAYCKHRMTFGFARPSERSSYAVADWMSHPEQLQGEGLFGWGRAKYQTMSHFWCKLETR